MSIEELKSAADRHPQIGSLLFEGIDQIDLTGPFEVLSRIPSSTYRIYGLTAQPVRDLKGLRLTPDGDPTSANRRSRASGAMSHAQATHPAWPEAAHLS